MASSASASSRISRCISPRRTHARYNGDTVGCNYLWIVATPGRRNSSQTYSRQYEHRAIFIPSPVPF
ncbi:hypothetical protein EGO51_02640 [Haloarcula hispanica]|uniref:Uncharacterized protein n=1 Tax=Haloarcula hispanica TaxID=51589 RepID=A0A5J5LG98_HALHI|nr:hypothetical protein EGO51_02640 [Haloarcula hispanica]